MSNPAKISVSPAAALDSPRDFPGLLLEWSPDETCNELTRIIPLFHLPQSSIIASARGDVGSSFDTATQAQHTFPVHGAALKMLILLHAKSVRRLTAARRQLDSQIEGIQGGAVVRLCCLRSIDNMRCPNFPALASVQALKSLVTVVGPEVSIALAIYRPNLLAM